MKRIYLPTLADLIDRLSIVLMKQIFIDPEHYGRESFAIIHDIDLLLIEQPLDAFSVKAILMLMLANRFIWENESAIRSGGENSLQQLRATHSINGIRNRAKNVLLNEPSRGELKLDCLAAELPPEFGNWNVF